MFQRFSGNANSSVNFLPGNFQLGVSVKVWQINEDCASFWLNCCSKVVRFILTIILIYIWIDFFLFFFDLFKIIVIILIFICLLIGLLFIELFMRTVTYFLIVKILNDYIFFCATIYTCILQLFQFLKGKCIFFSYYFLRGINLPVIFRIKNYRDRVHAALF